MRPPASRIAHAPPANRTPTTHNTPAILMLHYCDEDLSRSHRIHGTTHEKHQGEYSDSWSRGIPAALQPPPSHSFSPPSPAAEAADWHLKSRPPDTAAQLFPVLTGFLASNAHQR